MVNELQGMYYLGSYIDAKVEEEKNRRKHKGMYFVLGMNEQDF